jgi:hypothetical protein
VTRTARGASRRLVVTAAVMLWASAPPSLPAQEDRATLPSSLSVPTRNAILALADSLSREGLPGKTLHAKAAEGVLKGAGEALILVAVRSIATRLRDARRTLGPSASTAELEAAASALFAGVAPHELTRLAQLPRAGALSLAYSLTVLADLVSNGVPAARATKSIELLTTRGAFDRHLAELRSAFDQELRAGESPTESLNRGTEQVLRTIRPPSP